MAYLPLDLNPTNAVSKLEGRLPKVITPRVHGIIDYAHAAFFFGMALVCRRSNKPAALAALGTGSFILAQSMLTDYPLGVKPVMSFATHGKQDAAMASSSWLIPKLMGFSGTVAARVFEANSLVEAGVAAMTDFSGGRAKAERLAD